jgi:protein transport protein SEC31
LLAAGTVAGTMSREFDATGTLELLSFSPYEINNEMKVVGRIKSNERFCKLIWAPTASSTEIYKHGIIVGGLTNGAVSLWNPNILLQ